MFNSNMYSQDARTQHLLHASPDNDHMQAFTPLLDLNAVSFEQTLGEDEVQFLQNTYPQPRDSPAASRPKHYVAIPSTNATTHKKLKSNANKKSAAADEGGYQKHRSDLQSSVFLSRSKGSLMTASSVGSAGDDSGAGGSPTAASVATIASSKKGKKKAKQSTYNYERDVNNYVVRQTVNGVTRVLHKDGTVAEYRNNSPTKSKETSSGPNAVPAQGKRDGKERRGNSDSFQLKGAKDSEKEEHYSPTSNVLAFINERNTGVLTNGGGGGEGGEPMSTGGGLLLPNPRVVLSAPPAPSLPSPAGALMLPSLVVQHQGPRRPTHIGFTGEGADDNNTTFTQRPQDQRSSPQRLNMFTPPNNGTRPRNRRAKDSIVNITFMEEGAGDGGNESVRDAELSRMSVDNTGGPSANLNLSSPDEKGDFFMTGLDTAFNASSGGTGFDVVLAARGMGPGEKREDNPFMTPAEEEMTSQLLAEHKKKREATRRVFKLDAESLFSIELPLFDENGDLLAVPVPQKGSEMAAAEAARIGSPTAPLKEGEGKREKAPGDQQTFVYEYKDKEFLNSTFPNGVTPLQLHNYLLSKEKNKRIRTQFSEWNISRFMEQPVATQFIVTYFWFVVVRSRLTWVEKLLEGRYQRLVKAYDGLYITKDQKRGTLPTLTTLDALASELIAADYVWGQRQHQNSASKIESAEAGQLMLCGSGNVENKLLPFLTDNGFTYLCQMREVQRLGMLPESDAIEMLCDALDYFVTAMEEYEHLVHLEEVFFGRLALAFGGSFLQLGAEKDFVFRQFSFITARIVYYVLNACFPNDAHARVFDANFRSDLVVILQHWYSGLVVTCVPISGWPVPSVEDVEAMEKMRERTARGEAEEPLAPAAEPDDEEEETDDSIALAKPRHLAGQNRSPDGNGTTAAGTCMSGSFSSASAFASPNNRTGGGGGCGEAAVVVGADTTEATARKKLHKSRALQDETFEEVDVSVENGGYRLISEFHKRANHASDLVAELEKRVKQQHKKQRRKLDLAQRQADRGAAQTFTNRNTTQNMVTNTNTSFHVNNAPYDDDGDTISLDSMHSGSFYSFNSSRVDNELSDRRKASHVSKASGNTRHTTDRRKSKHSPSMQSNRFGVSTTVSTSGFISHRAAPHGEKSTADKINTVERRRMQLTKKAGGGGISGGGGGSGPQVTAVGSGGMPMDNSGSVNLLTLANRAEEAFRRNANTADGKEAKDSLAKRSKRRGSGDVSSPNAKQKGANNDLHMPENEGDEYSILTRFPIARCSGALRAYLLERAGLHYTDVPIAPSSLAAEAMIELQEHQKAHEKTAPTSLTAHTTFNNTNNNSAASTCRFHSMKLKGMDGGGDDSVAATTLNASMAGLVPPALGGGGTAGRHRGSVSSVFFRANDPAALDANTSSNRPAFRLPAVTSQSAQLATKHGPPQRAMSTVSCNTRMLPHGPNDIEGPPLNVRKHELSRGLLERFAVSRQQQRSGAEQHDGVGSNQLGGSSGAADTRSALPSVSPFVAYYARNMLQLNLAAENNADAAAAANKVATADASLLDFSTQAGLGQSMVSRMHNGLGASTRSLVITGGDGNDTFNAAVVAQKSHRVALRQLTVLPREAGQQRPQLLQGVHQEALRRQQNAQKELELIAQRDQVSRAMYTNQCIESSTEASAIESDKMRAQFRRKAKRAFELKEKADAQQQQQQQQQRQRQRPSEAYNSRATLTE